jgi:hypothetical protein
MEIWTSDNKVKWYTTKCEMAKKKAKWQLGEMAIRRNGN